MARQWFPQDLCVVETSALADVIEMELDRRFIDRKRVDWLAERTAAADPSGAGLGPRAINNVLKRRKQFTDLAVADALLVVVRRAGVLYDGTVEIQPNPERESCCPSYRPAAPIRLRW
jgi:hypothetical protein